MSANESTAKLNVTPEYASKILSWVNHDTFDEAREEHWIVDGDGNVKAQSALWLYCWAKTGMNSKDVARQVTKIFNEIMNITFEDFDKKIPHEWAQEMRYHDGDIETEFASYFS